MENKNGSRTEQKTEKRSFSIALFIIIISFGVIIGHGLYTFVYAEGFSYFSDDPAACKNCHVMNQVYESWERGGHQNAATCNQCHVPHEFFSKWIMKAKSGLHHGYAFTFKDNPVAFSATQESKQIVQQNCISCHKDVSANSICGANVATVGNDGRLKLPAKNEELSCVSCHKQAGHAHNY